VHAPIRFAAYLVPANTMPPLLQGEPQLPGNLAAMAIASHHVEASPGARTIQFADHTWYVKTSANPVGPGPNLFSDHPEDVWVDAAGRLHLHISLRDNRWYSSEVFSRDLFGYGRFTFQLAAHNQPLDHNVVLGLFFWDDTTTDPQHREIDIELARWGIAANANAQFVVQPWEHPANLYRFNLAANETTTHRFDWAADYVQFTSFYGHRLLPEPGQALAAWHYTGTDVPPAGLGNARINLWLLDGNPPADGQPVEVIISAFDYEAAGAAKPLTSRQTLTPPDVRR
jgi:hypothetical protein